MTRSISAILLLFALVGEGVARADDPPCKQEAAAVAAMKPRDPALKGPPKKANPDDDHFQKGNSALTVGDFATAIKEYTAAGMESSEPVILYDLGQSYRGAKQYELATREYQLFLDGAQPGPEVTALVQCHIKWMKNEMDHAASTAPPQGPASDVGAGTGTKTTPDPATTTDAALRVSATRSPIPSPWYADWVGWTVSGGGALATGGGIVLLLDASDLDNQADLEDRQDVRAQLRSEAHTRRIWGIATSVVGIAGLAIGVVKLAITPSGGSAEPARGHALSLVVDPGGAIGLAGTF